MPYNNKPKMILFEVGGTLFDDGKCDPVAGFSELLNYADNPNITDGNTPAKLWDEYLNMVHGSKSESGLSLEIPLSAIIMIVGCRNAFAFRKSRFYRLSAKLNFINTILHYTH